MATNISAKGCFGARSALGTPTRSPCHQFDGLLSWCLRVALAAIVLFQATNAEAVSKFVIPEGREAAVSELVNQAAQPNEVRSIGIENDHIVLRFATTGSVVLVRHPEDAAQGHGQSSLAKAIVLRCSGVCSPEELQRYAPLALRLVPLRRILHLEDLGPPQIDACAKTAV